MRLCYSPTDFRFELTVCLVTAVLAVISGYGKILESTGESAFLAADSEWLNTTRSEHHMALLAAIVICVFVLLFALTIPICGLLPAIRMGPIQGKGERRLRIAWWVAVTLNIAAAVVPLYGRLGFLLCPSIAFGLAACVGGFAGRNAWLYGPLSSFWFFLPQLFFGGGATPTNELDGRWIPLVTALTVGGGILGGLVAALILDTHAAPSNCEDPHSSADRAGHNSFSPR